MGLQPKIHVFYGPMFAGKTSHMVEAVRNHVHSDDSFKFFKPIKDTRSGTNYIVTHLEAEMGHKGTPAQMVETAADIYDHLTDEPLAIGIDEANFFDAVLVDVVSDLFDKGNAVYISMLDLDFARKPFGLVGGKSTGDLMAIATNSTRLTSKCTNLRGDQKCGADALYSHALVEMDGHYKVGGQDEFIPVCDTCYRSLNGLYIPT